MMSAIEWDSLLTWILVGCAGGVLCAVIFGGRRLLVYDIVIGVLGAVAGGWGSAIAMGDSTQYLYIVSSLTALFVAAVALWLFNVLLARGRRGGD